ncbi:hypothetical protein ACFQZS_16180 [Mucilaginibacter calamicampi]|uniref:PpiC domain-containing protein n=1 Tax=Mucilaginibacter calamicampi TaxID=1302352 RepID=A0ABW2Z1E9_9SPHI
MRSYLFSTLIFLISITALSSCKQKDAANNASATPTGAATGDVDEKVILEVGSEKFTVFELQKHFKMFTQNFTQKSGRYPGQGDVKLWANDFIERAYILADARAQGYYDRADVQSTAESVAVMMLTQPNGIIDKKIMEGVSADEVKKAVAAQPGVNINVVTNNLKQKAIANYHEKIKIRSTVKADKQVVAVLNKALAKYEKAHEIKKADITDILNADIATYRNPENKIIALRVADLADYYNNLPIKLPIVDTTVILEYIQNWASNIYIINDAKKMGVLDNPEFKLSKKNFTDNVVFRKYQDEQLTGDPKVTENEILSAYNGVKGYMLRPTQIVYGFFTFANFQDAIEAQNTLRLKPTDTTRLKNALSEKRHIKFDEGSKQLIDTLRKTLIRLQPGQSSMPVQTKDYYTVLYMESAGGTQPLQISDLRTYLVALALEKRRATNRHARIAKLAEKYKKTGDLDAALLAEINTIPSS